MGSNLDQVHFNLGRIASALSSNPVDLMEAKKRKPKVKFGSPKEKKGQGPGRKQRKQQRKQEKFYQGQEPVRSESGRSVPIGEPFRSPQNRPSSPPSTPVRPQAPSVAPQSRPSHGDLPSSEPAKALPLVLPPEKSVEPSEKPQEAPTKSSTEPKTPQLIPTKSRLVTEPVGAPRSGSSFLQRVKSTPSPEEKKPGLPGRAIGVLKRIASLVKRRMLGEECLPRTFVAMGLTEERSSTTFKKCSPGAMLSTPYLRHSLPLNLFVNPDDDNPTFPIRANCRASLAGVGRALQKDMAGSGEATVKQALQRVNQMGGTRGKTRLKLWGTGVGGKRMETYRGPPHKPLRTSSLAKRLKISKKKAAALHGISTGRPDMVKHTSPYSPVGGAKGPSGNREVHRAEQAHAKPERKRSKRKERRVQAGREVTIARGKALAGR